MTENERKRIEILNKILAQLESLYQDYWKKSKTPGMLDALRIFNSLMQTWDAYRSVPVDEG